LLSFQSDESGKVETYVALYATGGIVGAPMMVSNGGGTGAEWAADNRRLFFEQPDGQIAYVTVDTKPSLTASKPVVAYDTKKLHTSNGWTILADGSLFTIQRSEAEDDDVSSFNVVFNWFDELRARMGRGVGK
jgi:hypothetical protein